MSILTDDCLFFLIAYDALTLYLPGNIQPKRLVFPSALIANQEVVDKIALDKLLTDFLTPFKGHHSVVLLSGDLLYSTLLDATDKNTVFEKMDTFQHSLPFSQEQITTKLVDLGKQSPFFAINKDLYAIILSVCSRLNISTRAVEPLPLFIKSSNPNSYSHSYFLNLFSDRTIFDKGNFLMKSTLDISLEQKEKAEALANLISSGEIPGQNMRRQYLTLLAVFIFFISALIYAFFSLKH